MNIRTQLYAVTAVSAAIAMCVAFSTLLIFQRVNQARGQSLAGRAVVEAVFELDLLTTDYLFHPQERPVKQWQARYRSLDRLLGDLRFSNSGQQKRLQALRANCQDIQDLFGQMASKEDAAEGQADGTLQQTFRSMLAGQLRSKSQAMVDEAFALTDAADDRLRVSMGRAHAAILGAILVLVGVTVANAFLFTRSILRPIARLHEGVEVLGRGDLGHRLHMDAENEMGRLGRAFDRMAGDLQATLASRDELAEALAARNKTEKALRASERKHRTLLENLPQKIFYKDRESVYVACNQNYARDLGIEADQIAGMTDFDFYPDDLAKKYRADDRRVRESDRTEEIEEEYIQEGQRRIIHTVKTPVKDAAGMPAGILGIFWDITERKRAEQQLHYTMAALESSNRELEQFAYAASHDLQEPLRKIRAFGDRLEARQGAALDEEGADYLHRMLAAAERMSVLIDALLSLSRVTTRTKPFEPVDLGRTVQGVLGDLELRISELGASVEVDELPTIEADPAQIGQLFLNLIGNALKFHKEDVAPVVRVTSTTRREGDGAVCEISVSDNGIGFDQKYADRIFALFQRLHGRHQYPGTGIGLALCRKIVLRHGGTIRVHSREGEGATFIVTLPLTQPKRQEA